MSASTNLRPDLGQHLRQRLQAFGEGFRHNLALIGPPGSGKTFQLQQLSTDAAGRLTVLYCPVYRESCHSFLTRFLSAGLQCGLPEASHMPLETLLPATEARLPKTVAAARTVESLLNRRQYSEAFTRTLDTVPVLTAELGRPTVLLLDEFLFLEELGLGHAFHELGKRVMVWPSVLFILASSSPYRARMILRERLQLLFGQFELVSLEGLNAEHAGRWMVEALEGLSVSPTVTTFLIRWLGAFPWYLTAFLKRLKERAVLAQTTTVTEGLCFETLWDVLGSSQGMLHQWCVSRTEQLANTRQRSRSMEVLVHIAGGVRTTTAIGRRVGRAGLAGILQLLVEHDLVQRKGTCWFIPDPVLRCWLTTVVAETRTQAGPDEAVLRDRFESYLLQLWQQWLTSSQLSFCEQVVRRFESFRDDTVLLGSKTGRLPRFETIRTVPEEGPGTGTYLMAEGDGKRWCAVVQEGLVDENLVTRFDIFCRVQAVKPSRKVVITRAGIDSNARLLAKAANMWVWQSDDLNVLDALYGDEAAPEAGVSAVRVMAGAPDA